LFIYTSTSGFPQQGTDFDELSLRSIKDHEEGSNRKANGHAKGGAKLIEDALKVIHQSKQTHADCT
jgi:hypothetical protein